LTQRARLWHPSIASAAGSLIGSQPTGVWAVSLNHRRRIFRPGTGPAPLRHRRRPSPGLWLAASGGAATLLTATWLFIRSSDAPAHGPASTHVAASADSLAVLDGDTMRVGDQVVRLHGIAAPRRGSVCHSGATQVIAARQRRMHWRPWCAAVLSIASSKAMTDRAGRSQIVWPMVSG
jgi:hypothetical protein